jgi:hypothetical protein
VKFPLVEDGSGTQAVHDTIVAYNAAQRRGTACTKTMGEVAGSGKKPWRQKGTGRARAGSFASPLWRGGGVTFGPKPRDFSKKVIKKVLRLDNEELINESYDLFAKAFLPVPYPNTVGMKTSFEYIATTRPEVWDHKPEEFVDKSFIEELDKNGFIKKLYEK